MSDSVMLPNWAKSLNESDEMRRISNSEASAFLQCERKWYYQYALNLEPIKHSESLSRGVIGHECLAVYYEHLLVNPEDFATAEQKAQENLFKYFQTEFETEMLSNLLKLLQRYFSVCRDYGWKILQVERLLSVPVNDDYEYVMRLDLLVRLRDGRVALVDHKFVYDFYPQDVIDMNVQLPKYMGALAYNDTPVDVAILNQLRHRLKKGTMTDDELFRQSQIKPTGKRIQNIMREQFRASDQIVNLLNMPDKGESVVLRTQNQMNCKNCPMMILCSADLDGSDTTLMKQIEFRQNVNYGYNFEESAV